MHNLVLLNRAIRTKPAVRGRRMHYYQLRALSKRVYVGINVYFMQSAVFLRGLPETRVSLRQVSRVKTTHQLAYTFFLLSVLPAKFHTTTVSRSRNWLRASYFAVAVGRNSFLSRHVAALGVRLLALSSPLYYSFTSGNSTYTLSL